MSERLLVVLDHAFGDSAEGTLRFFVALVGALRPADPHDAASAARALATLRDAVRADPRLRGIVRQRLRALIGDTQHVSLLTDAGVLPNSGLFSELRRRLAARALPEVPNARSLKDCFDCIFQRRDDAVWIAAGPLEDKRAVWDAIFGDSEDVTPPPPWRLHAEMQALEAMQVLATRIGAMGLEPELTRVQPHIGHFESPFVHLGAEVLRFTEAWRARVVDPTAARVDELHMMVLVDQCRDVMTRARRNAATSGASLSLTFLMVRTEQCLERLVQVTGVLCARFQPDPRLAEVDRWTRLTHDLAQGEFRRHSLAEPFRRLTGLLALRVTEHGRLTGEHYITTDGPGYVAMWRSAAGGGFVVSLVAFVKLLLGAVVVGPLATIGLIGLNYASGFVLIHMLGFTLATKQPAMTAATVAATLNASEGRKRDLHQLADLVVATIRSQVAAIGANVVVAMPTALAVAAAWHAVFGRHAIDVDKAHHTLHDLSPFASLAIPDAAITGVLLFIASLISGYLDNMAAYDRITERVAHLHWLRTLLGPSRAARVGDYLGHNLGALGGNVVLGFMLAAVAPVGALMGLPVGIRHVTVSSANAAYALVALDLHVDAATIASSVIGLVLIGATNLSVSFSLALWVALRARDADVTGGSGLRALLWARARAAPLQFLCPPRAAVPTP